MTGGAWERERLLRRAALKLKDPCITARRNGSTTDGSISQKAANSYIRASLATSSTAGRNRSREQVSGRKGRRLADLGDEKIVGARVGASALYIIWILSGAHEGGIAVIFITTVAQSLFLLFFCQTGKNPRIGLAFALMGSGSGSGLSWNGVLTQSNSLCASAFMVIHLCGNNEHRDGEFQARIHMFVDIGILSVDL